jgi:putative iron-regulated protein
MKLTRLALTVATASLITACGGGSSSSGSDISIDNVAKVLNTNAEIAYAAYSDSVTTAIALKAAIDALANDPTDANLQAAKTAWLVAREPYGQTEVYRFRLSPIDSTDYDQEDGPEGDINAWPLGEALIDYVETNTTDFGTDQIGVTDNSVEVGEVTAAGAYAITAANHSFAETIIGRTDITIDADLLANTATADDEHDVISGYHAIEFLLWGQDLNNNGDTTDGTDRDDAVKANGASNIATGGQRPLSDFTAATYGERRLTYLQVAAQKLIDDLTAVRDGWAPGVSDNYRAQFTAVSSEAEAKQKMAEILTGMGTLSEGELAGERMQIAFASNSQEDEHSCFSDNTHRDIAMDALGVANSYYGEYKGYDSDLDGDIDSSDAVANAVSGYGIDNLLADSGLEDIAAELDAAFTLTETNYMAIDAKARAGQPFDVLIMDDNRTATNPVYLTIKSLNAQASVIADLAEELELDVEVVDPDASECDTSNPAAEC